MYSFKYSYTHKAGFQALLILTILFLNFGPSGLNKVYAAPPSNDSFSTPTDIVSLPFSTSLDTTEATQSATDPDNIGPCDTHQLNIGNNTVWYRFAPSVDALISVDAIGTDTYDTYIAVWTGTEGNLSLVACDDDNVEGYSELVFSATTGTTYYIEVAEFNGYEGGTEGAGTGGQLVFHVNTRQQTFADVPTTHPYWPYVEALYANGLTNGCSTTTLLYCPSSIMNRAQVAKFFLTVIKGGTYLPPANTPIMFTDSWQINPWAELWANDMYDKGLTNGCNPSPLRYCPDTEVIREQVAKFGLSIKYGNTYEPPPATGTVFADLPDPGYWATAWAEQAYADNLVPDCGMDLASGKPKFCPYGKVDRGFAAFVIVTATGLLP